MKSDRTKKIEQLPGEAGLPRHYPVPPEKDDLLFYIQRNQNENTVIYELNRNQSGLLNLDLPMVASWIQYSWGGKKKDLNYIQSKLAYGYSSQEISSELVQFNFVSYQELKFYIVKNANSDQYMVTFKFNNKQTRLKNIYVYAHELGVFPDVKYIELYGEDLHTNLPVYQKIFIEK
ncbi:MAG: DUF4833 domain-containing protein [Saprospiraceae bacterium]